MEAAETAGSGQANGQTGIGGKVTVETAVETAVRKAKETPDGLVVLGSAFTFGLLGLSVDKKRKPTLEECDDALQRIQAVIGAIRYNRGDLIRYIETHHQAHASQIISADVIDEREANADRFVAERVDQSVRKMAKTYEHAKAVAALHPDKQKKLLQLALDNEWVASKVKDEATKTANDGKEVLKFWLVVECGTEGKRDKLAADLETQGFAVKSHSGVKREKKSKKKAAKKREKKGPITAQKKRAQKINTKRRPPK